MFDVILNGSKFKELYEGEEMELVLNTGKGMLGFLIGEEQISRGEIDWAWEN